MKVLTWVVALWASVAVAQSDHAFRFGGAAIGDPVDATSPQFQWHLGYEGRFSLSPQFDAGVLVSARPTSLTQLGDTGSHLWARYRPEGWRPVEGWSLTVFPFSSSRYRLAVEPLFTVGADPYFRDISIQPAAAVGFRRGPWSAELGLKTAVVLDELTLENRRHVAPMARAGWVGPAGLRFELGGMFAPQGNIPGLAAQGIRVDTWTLAVAPRILGGWGSVPDELLVVSRLYQTPEFYERLAAPRRLQGTGLSAEVEAIGVVQRLEDSERFGAAKLQPGLGLKARLTYQSERTRAQLFALTRDVALIQSDTSGFPPFRAFPQATETSREFRVEAAAEHTLRTAVGDFSPGLVASALLPATFLPPATLFGGNIPPQGLGRHRVVVTGVNQFAILPTGDDVMLSYRFSAVLAYAPAPMFLIHAEAGYGFNPNRTTFRDDVTGLTEPDYESPHQFSGMLFVQVRL